MSDEKINSRMNTIKKLKILKIAKDKDYINIQIGDLLKLPNLKNNDLQIIKGLEDSIKQGTIIPFILGFEDIQKDKEKWK